MVEAGYSNVVVAEGRLYATGSRENRLVVTSLDAAQGAVLWQQAFPDISDVPQATPAVDGNRLYVIGKFGALVCLNTADGSLVWQAALPPSPNQYLYAASPISEGNLVLINAHYSGMAFDKQNGSIV